MDYDTSLLDRHRRMKDKLKDGRDQCTTNNSKFIHLILSPFNRNPVVVYRVITAALNGGTCPRRTRYSDKLAELQPLSPRCFSGVRHHDLESFSYVLID